MSRTAAATTAGRSIPRTPTPALPRRVSGPAGPARRDPNGGRDDASAQARERSATRSQERSSARSDARARSGVGPSAQRAAYGSAEAAAGAAPRRAPRARIDPSALAYADGAVAVARAVAVPLPRPFRAPNPRPRRGGRPAPRPQRLAYGGVAIASRMANVAIDVSASRLMDRVVRSRVWIGLIAIVLIGIVAMQVSMLKLNSGITNAMATTSTLEQSNVALRRDISRLSAGDRIQPLAEAQGFVMPAPEDVDYLDARHDGGVAARAAQRMTKPDPAIAGFGGAVDDGQLAGGVTPPAGGATAGTTAAPGTSSAATTTSTSATGAAATATGTAPATAAQAGTAPATATTVASPAGAPSTATVAATGATASDGAAPPAAAQATPQTP